MTDKTKLAGGIELSANEIKDAEKEGALDYAKEGGRRAMATDTGTTSDLDKAAEVETKRVSPSLNTTFLAPLLDLSADELAHRLTDEKAGDHIEFENAKGLLALERAGKNRTDYVKVLCEAIGVKSPYEVTNSGPPYTNDVSSVTNL